MGIRYTSMLSSTPSQDRALATSRNIMANLDRMAASAGGGAASHDQTGGMQLYRPPRPLRRRRPPLNGGSSIETHTGMKSLSALLAKSSENHTQGASPAAAAAALPSATSKAFGMHSPVFGSSGITKKNTSNSNANMIG